MELAEYLRRNRLSLGKVAKQCGTSASTIVRIREKEVSPSKRVAKAIWQFTGGAVSPNDLFGLHYPQGKCSCMAVGHIPTSVEGASNIHGDIEQVEED